MLLPAVLRNWRAFLWGEATVGAESRELTVCVLLDYQNVHLTAHDLFAPVGTPVRDSLVHPLAFAEKVLEVRSVRQQIPAQKLTRLEAVRVFRGSPSNHREPGLYRAAQRQRAMWSRDPRVDVTYRTLRYPGSWGDPRCRERPREKGIDVLVALELVDLARVGSYDTLILASHDTDMEPAIERALKEHRARIETTGWQGARRLKPSRQNIWHTSLDGADFVKTRDRRDYW
jgi:uncharacterized LabA/DUF88 family protein